MLIGLYLPKRSSQIVFPSALPSDHRQVIELRNFEQMDFEAIGQQMNRTAGAARKLWARAVEALQTNLSHASEDLFSQIMHPDVENE